MRNLEQKPTKGYITHDDVIRLSKLQNEFFPDYDFLQRCLDEQSEAIKEKRRPLPLRDLI